MCAKGMLEDFKRQHKEGKDEKRGIDVAYGA